MFSRTTVPSVFGVRPRSLRWIAFSMAPRALRSHGWMTMLCASGTLMLASWLSGVVVP
jgi:hypothetical protein